MIYAWEVNSHFSKMFAQIYKRTYTKYIEMLKGFNQFNQNNTIDLS